MKKLIGVLLILPLLAITSCTLDKVPKLQPLQTMQQFYDVLEKNDVSYIYFGRESCKDCVEFRPLLQEAIIEKNQTVYYFNTDILKSEGGYEETIEIFGVDWVPSLYKMNQSKIVDCFPLKFSSDYTNEERKKCVQKLLKFL